jgi:hypothetical protein
MVIYNGGLIGYGDNTTNSNNYWFNTLSPGNGVGAGTQPTLATSADDFKGFGLETKNPFAAGKWDFATTPVWYMHVGEYPDFVSGELPPVHRTTHRTTSGSVPSPVVVSQPDPSPTPVPVSVPEVPKAKLCPADQLLTQNLRAPSQNGKYSKYTKGIVKESKISGTHEPIRIQCRTCNGFMGPLTDEAIKRMQKFLGTFQDGMVGPLTRALINNSCKKNYGNLTCPYITTTP